MNENHALLAQMGVSCPELEALTQAARQSGALGAKLSGAGRGGNMVALAAEPEAERIAQALMDNGAARVLISTVREPGSAAHTGQTG
jgi:mevalonate kinase